MSSSVVRVRLDLRYDGSAYAGWARQLDLPSVQQAIEDGLARVVRPANGQPGASLRLTVAGRTDAGVHAAAQVAHVDIPVADWEKLPGRVARSPQEALITRLAGVLPPDIVVWRAEVVSPDFDARFSALWRHYRYRISDSVLTRDPLRRAMVLHHRRPLDAEVMHAAAQSLLGEQDFYSFCKPRPFATTVRTLQRLDVSRQGADSPDGGLVTVDVVADAFCHNMVRSLVGALLEVGDGRKPLTWPAQILEQRARGLGVTVAPAHGLMMEAVAYPAESDLAARAARTRARRN